MATDGLVTKAARASATGVVTLLSYATGNQVTKGARTSVALALTSVILQYPSFNSIRVNPLWEKN